MNFHPIVEEWFTRSFPGATEAQQQAWPEIEAGRDVLVSAPTGSGKTLAAFLVCLDRLTRRALTGALEDHIDTVYVSPLKALGNDIQKNLERPLAEIAALAAEKGYLFPPIRVAVRTGDTPIAERQKMARQAPHILVTTPESLYILLTAERSRAQLKTARTLIVDEIHALIDDKRGAHLGLSIARLEDLITRAGNPPLQRVGLSATARPIEEVARFLKPGGAVRIIDSGHRRKLDLAVEVPRDELGSVASNEMWAEMYDRLAEIILEHRTTLVFVNTRRLSERVAHHLAERLGVDVVLAHHGSLSRGIRLDAEQRLKSGSLRAVVATASLELGIDIGSVELVCQIGSPRSIAVALQRIGRSGHHADPLSVPKGRLFATTRDELIECAALVHGIRGGALDALAIPPWPLDVLAQQIVAAAACEPDGWREQDLYALTRRAYSYRDLPRQDFDATIAMLSDGISTQRGRKGAFLHRDQVHGIVRPRRGARLAAITSGGAIPDNANYFVVAEPEGTIVGTVDEDFAVESLAGDVFLLGTTSWRIRRVEAGRVRVEDARGAAPSIPFWRGEAPGRTIELSEEVSKVRSAIIEQIDPVAWLQKECALDLRGAEQAALYIRAGKAALGALPGQHTVVAERFFDEGGGMQLTLHAPFGSAINRAWGLALRKRFCRTFNFELQAAATDNGIVISLGEQHSFPLDLVFQFLNTATIEEVLTQAMLDSPMFTARWRWNASRALAVLRFNGGKKTPPPIQRMRSDDLLAAVFPDQAACGDNIVGDIRIPDHPLVNETIRDCLHEAMDLDGLKALLTGIANGAITTVAIDTAEPSPLAHEILNANPYAYLDDAPLEERRARAVAMRRTLSINDAAEIGALDPAAIAEVRNESWPVVRDAEELHDALLTLVAIPSPSGRGWAMKEIDAPGEGIRHQSSMVQAAPPEWEAFFNALESQRRATTITPPGQASHSLWVAAERLDIARGIYAGGDATPIVRGWLESTGPLTAAELSGILGLPLLTVDTALTTIEAEGQVLRGHFRSRDGAIEWCDRRLLARIHRLTLGRLRREIEPVSAADFMRFLFTWQHMTPGTQLHGMDGALQIVKQLQGYEISAAAWESEILPRRIARYTPDLLDRLCLSGEAMWGRLSPRTAISPDTDARAIRRARPTRSAPITIFLREDAAWINDPAGRAEDLATLSHPAREVMEVLTRRGASFFKELVAGTGRLASEVEDAVWELAATGWVTADGFDNLRALVDPKRRRGEGREKLSRPRHAAGRWALLERSNTRTATERAEAFAQQLLLRWGVVFRDLLARETLAPAWRDLLLALRRMEARGEIRGGRFVAGFVGEQFAKPEALDLLRAGRRSGNGATALRAAAADPLNLLGIVTPGPRISPLAGVIVDLLAEPARSA